jgi:c-di-GMP-binding flagellar brake protein YcgR
MIDHSQRRDYFRLEASSTPDWVRVLDVRGEVVEAIEARILDVSATGLRLHVREGLVATGTRLAVRFRVANEAFAARGRVVWTDVSELSKTQLAGLQFDDDEPLHQRLVRVIYDAQRDQLRRRAPR